ncbi:MAG: DUF3168 domain-containing protein [Bacteroidota bacterium]|jgi:hypothetical protein
MANSLEIVVSLLLDDAGVAALVGNRIFPVLAPQNAVMPNIVVTQISDNDPPHLGGASRLPDSRLSIVSRGSTATEMMNVADAVKAALRDVIHQSVGGSPPLSDDVTIWKTAVDITSVFDNPTTYEQSVDYMIRWRE